MNNKVMTHVVAGYPTKKDCITLMLEMQSAGVVAIEVQIPFSDPGADGPTIMRANDIALHDNMSVAASFAMIRDARSQGLDLPIYVMSYANKIFTFGLKKFSQQAALCSVSGLIVPDLPVGTPEYSQLLVLCNDSEISVVPVLSPGISKKRLKQYRVRSSKFVYVTSIKGITGKDIEVRRELLDLIDDIRKISECRIGLGFGIRTPTHVQHALEIADLAIVGSEVIRAIEQGGVLTATRLVKQLVRGIT